MLGESGLSGGGFHVKLDFKGELSKSLYEEGSDDLERPAQGHSRPAALEGQEMPLYHFNRSM